MSVEIANFARIKAEQQLRKERKIALREAFSEVNLLVINTGKHLKAEAAARIAAALVDPRLNLDSGRVLRLSSTKDEPMRVRASEVALFKAQTAREGFLLQQFPELIFLFNQLKLAFDLNLGDPLIKELLANIVFFGGDINAFVDDPQTALPKQSHKEERQFPNGIDEKEYERIRNQLYQTYVYPKNGQSRVMWDISSLTLNGKVHEFTDYVEIQAKPVASELLELYLLKAIADGKILSSNTKLATLEMLMESGQITSVSRLPKELLKKGYKLIDFRQSAKAEELSAIEKSINTNEPVHVA